MCAELEQALRDKSSAEPKSAKKGKQQVARAAKATNLSPRIAAPVVASVLTGKPCLVDPPSSSTAAHVGTGGGEDNSTAAAHAMSSQIDEEIMQWSMGSSESDSAVGSGETESESEGDKEDLNIVTEGVVGEGQGGEGWGDWDDDDTSSSDGDDEIRKLMDAGFDAEAGETVADTQNGGAPAPGMAPCTTHTTLLHGLGIVFRYRK